MARRTKGSAGLIMGMTLQSLFPVITYDFAPSLWVLVNVESGGDFSALALCSEPTINAAGVMEAAESLR